MPGPDPLADVERALVDLFGQVPARASVSFVGVEPIEVLRFETTSGVLTYVSLGMARRPMTAATEVVASDTGPRAELLLQVRPGGDADAVVWQRLAVLAAAPAVEGVVYTPGMTVDLGEPLGRGSRCTGGVIVESLVPAVTTGAGPVDVLEVAPATSTELAWCRVHGSAALRERWTAQGVDLHDLSRAAADLSPTGG
jgi:hypothetical protein